jgi:thiamine biosynthesis lipoprotein
MNIRVSIYGTLLGIILCLSACDSTNKQSFRITGETMGTYYRVTIDSTDRSIQQSIDSILVKLNKELSTYDPESLISQFNESKTGVTIEDSYLDLYAFQKNLTLSKTVNQLSNGAFDPSLMPVINYWGFGYKGRNAINRADSMIVDSLMALTGLKHVNIDIDKNTISKSIAGLELDFSAIAKGYGVDLIAEYLDDRQIDNYLVDIGGESRAKGLNAKNLKWTLGLSTPKKDAAYSESILYLQLNDNALATSGNYINYHETDTGKSYGHTIDAVTGYPAKTDILSASVITDNCMTADAWTTTFMALGLNKSKELVEELDGIEALFIFESQSAELDTWYSSGFEQYILWKK